MANVDSYIEPSSKYEFLCNHDQKSAIFLKSVAKKSADQFRRKTNKRNKIKYDIGNRIITTKTGYNEVVKFFSRPANRKYELVVPCGNYNHEVCLFFRKNRALEYEIIYFNPNYSDVQDGVQSCRRVAEFIGHFKSNVAKIEGYHSPCGNEASRCSALTWAEMFNHVCHGTSPFSNPSLQLQNYMHLMSEKVYDKYHKTKNNQNFENIETWQECEEFIENATNHDMINISCGISDIFAKHIK